jgi:hypothetical protein
VQRRVKGKTCRRTPTLPFEESRVKFIVKILMNDINYSSFSPWFQHLRYHRYACKTDSRYNKTIHTFPTKPCPSKIHPSQYSSLTAGSTRLGSDVVLLGGAATCLWMSVVVAVLSVSSKAASKEKFAGRFLRSSNLGSIEVLVLSLAGESCCSLGIWNPILDSGSPFERVKVDPGANAGCVCGNRGKY